MHAPASPAYAGNVPLNPPPPPPPRCLQPTLTHCSIASCCLRAVQDFNAKPYQELRQEARIVHWHG